MASEYRLGTVQAAQFQNSTQYGSAWRWGSRCAEAGGTCSETLTNNALAEMPRSHATDNITLGGHYNYYSATAESGSFVASGNVRANESICPKRWLLPRDVTSGSGIASLSYSRLVQSHEIPGAGGGASVRKYPLSFTNTNLYSIWGDLSAPTQGGFVTTTTSGTNTKQYVQFYVTNNASISNENKAAGNSVRCILNPE